MRDDEEYSELKLKMLIVPEFNQWPEPKYTHWQRLYVVPTEARSRVAKVGGYRCDRQGCQP